MPRGGSECFVAPGIAAGCPGAGAAVLEEGPGPSAQMSP
eukprot:CAMPEP_0204326364 /NCGR_PEP_ID=MMETSP0469-20131031/11766_1 /ASSEMBLY_ACC=CAM_ASM_000384 /TAXON_ID=2969 /ORGANISM="Oxyrrhis marina" /LENGTH=38 /DNA_ID= /DNA_START= /DNA_END= /DNA_ORIENTATION=